MADYNFKILKRDLSDDFHSVYVPDYTANLCGEEFFFINERA